MRDYATPFERVHIGILERLSEERAKNNAREFKKLLQSLRLPWKRKRQLILTAPAAGKGSF